MGNEIERKYMVAGGDWRTHADTGTKMRQGYFTTKSGVSATVFTNSLTGEDSIILKTATNFGYDVTVLGLSKESAADLRAKSGHQDEIPLARNFEARTRVAGNNATLTFKSGKGISRREFETEVETARAEKWLAGEHIEGVIIAKTRYRVPLFYAKQIAEVDIYEGANAGLKTVEVELRSEREAVEPKAWIGGEVTDGDLGNASLALRPWTTRESKEKYPEPKLHDISVATAFVETMRSGADHGPVKLVDSGYNGHWEIIDEDAYGASKLVSVFGNLITLPVAGPPLDSRVSQILNDALLTGEAITSEQVMARASIVPVAHLGLI